ncbi:putative HTH-type transcriptional regulator [Mycolicibacterium vanbaalenii]|uniref:Putative HTH-type transcriptional regulator n=1 Tax=Mycolicibacterium vanbaalenii TaxID=110539 RepID=A0A5S9NII1_MYCVN|nr:MarR family transcriptional regulator [Mycolicibacterium vanbaalenii]CAA0089546.1 putative HTH-type transcriptional regulator [Mycolicibacterium vanbaalenii]
MPTPEDQPLGYLLYRAASGLRTEVCASALEPLNLSFPQYLCIRILSQHPGRSNADLARDLNVSPQAMNVVLRSLEARGVVGRPPSAASGRSLPAQLTREGIDLLRTLEAAVHAAEERVLAALTDAQRREFRQLLAALG